MSVSTRFLFANTVAFCESPSHLGTVPSGGVFVVLRLRVVIDELQLCRAHHAAAHPVARRAGASRAGGARVGGAATGQSRVSRQETQR